MMKQCSCKYGRKKSKACKRKPGSKCKRKSPRCYNKSNKHKKSVKRSLFKIFDTSEPVPLVRQVAWAGEEPLINLEPLGNNRSIRDLVRERSRSRSRSRSRPPPLMPSPLPSPIRSPVRPRRVRRSRSVPVKRRGSRHN
jgi:hypothetical protein